MDCAWNEHWRVRKELKEDLSDEWNNRHDTSVKMAERVERTIEEARMMAKWVGERLEERLGRQL